MEWVPLFFIDGVCHLLQSFSEVDQLSGSWSAIGAEHQENRRDLEFTFTVQSSKASYYLKDNSTTWDIGPICNLDLNYDRITSFEFESTANPGITRISLDELRLVVFPTVASLVMDCAWPYLPLDLVYFTRNGFIFEAFKNCPGFNQIFVEEQTLISCDFVAHQVALGNVEDLFLSDSFLSKKLDQTLREFVNSVRFRELEVPSLRNDFELAELFLKRALAGELTEGARISIKNATFNKNELALLYPECLPDAEEFVWLISGSNRVVAVSEPWPEERNAVRLTVL